MPLSAQEKRQLERMERALSRDATLRAVNDLFALPAPPAGPATRRPGGGKCRRTLRESRVVLSLVLTALAGMVCVLVAAPINHPIVAALGVTAAIVAGAIFVVTAVRLGATNEPLVPLLQQRRRVGDGPLIAKEK